MEALAVLLSAFVIFTSEPAAGTETYISEEYQTYVTEISEQYNVCPELIIAIIEHESSGRTDIESSAGCIGLMQISPIWHADRMERLGVTDLTDPRSNILVGVDYISELADRHGEIYTVLMCYNEGENGTAIERAEQGQYSDYAISIVERTMELERLHERKRKNGFR